MKIAVIGTGYIGLVSGVCLARIGHEVVCVDVDTRKIQALQAGCIPIFEPGLDVMLQQVVIAGNLKFTTDTLSATRSSDCIMIAVGTPTAADGMSSDLRFVEAAARDIAAGINAFKVVIIKSTVPAGTGQHVETIMRSANPSADFDMASNPEFLREGAAVFDFMNPDRIVIGTGSSRAKALVEGLYAYFHERGHTILHTDIATAELIKYAANGFLATKISFINEMAELCEQVGADVQDLARGMGLDERIGSKFLKAGPGFGGSCFPKDTRGLAALGHASNVQLRITEAVIASNEHAKARMVDKIRSLAGGSVKGKTLTIFGVTFKPDTDDMRDAPALDILPALMAEGARLVATDPQGQKHGAALLPGLAWQDDPYAAALGSDMIVVLTEWQIFRKLDLARLAKSMRRTAMADLRNIYDPAALAEAGFTAVTQVGRRTRA